MDFAQRWLLMLAIATAIFAILLLLLRVNIRTLAILMGIGLALVTLWMYLDARYFGGAGGGRNITSKQTCACPVCKHQHAKMCLQKKCACCLVTKDEKVVGHLSSALQ